MDKHGGDQARIVDLDADNGVSGGQPTPLGVNAGSVGKKGEPAFDFRAPVCLGTGQAKPVPISGACAHIPELHQILGYETELMAAGDKSIDGGTHDAVLRVRRIQWSQQNVRIE